MFLYVTYVWIYIYIYLPFFNKNLRLSLPTGIIQFCDLPYNSEARKTELDACGKMKINLTLTSNGYIPKELSW